MALSDSNTYIEPSAGTTLSTARLQQNQSYRSLLTNFSSDGPPVGANMTASGNPLTVSGAGSEVDGMLYHRSNSNGSILYISSKTFQKGAVAGTNFTRRGIFRSEENWGALVSNAHTYEIGELVSTANNDSTANSRLYLAAANSAGAAKFIDVGVPPTNGSVTNVMIGLGTGGQGSGVTPDRMNVTSVFNTGTSTNVTLALQSHFNHGGSGATATNGANVALGFNTQNSAVNAAIVFYGAGTGATVGTKAGLRVVDKTQANLAPFAANVLMQSTVGNGVGNNDVAPLVPVGSIMLWPETTAPSGWALADGTAKSRTQFAGLFALIATDYGSGDGTTTFNLPDFKDRVALGKGANNAVAAAQSRMRASSKLITDSGSAALTVATTSVAQSAKDSSTVTVATGVTAGGHTHTATVPSLTVNYIIKT